MPVIIVYAYVLDGLFWGFISKKVAENRGYYDANSFWWGFFLSLIGLIVVATRPARSLQQFETNQYTYTNNGWICGNCGTLNSLSGSSTCVSCGSLRSNIAQGDANGWRCQCGVVNASYVGTCRCGRLKPVLASSNETSSQPRIIQETLKTEQKPNTSTATKFEEIKAYKDLLDSGVITQEEFDKKKTELLGL